ncbi:GGDEF domain-containing protein [Ectothiorhodospira lacustris]|uniref:GGDEF domain-containing protein n=1 Tax=Ectothiorhodospira lacustris TaxID=2899127 RepID=UPI001EE7A866|nr:DUF484 family protein [Ectothiorhodospira lacustris]MCG5500684.1 sensor domain-containing diguanylate cyclase [Ectothiorhodospira lacustris]MCG5509930.1 sensor domain-containing diguanylate cyclase [Ectothiorhodospira lacustris]MCG5521184.1 sensor domain-containing diguanylate cyclase [Ectothiorhodospira lacustris]
MVEQARLEQENLWLRERLATLIEAARDNERKLDRMTGLEMRLLAADGLMGILSLLLEEFPRDYELDHVGLVLHDPDGVISTILDAALCPRGLWALKLAPSAEDLKTPAGLYLGDYAACPEALRFEGCGELGSVALLPVQRAGRCLGVLSLGSRCSGRYGEGMDTYLLRRLAAVVAICIENALAAWRLQELGVTDALTGVRNRRFFDLRLQEEMTRVVRERQSLACLFVDIDHFKAVNDGYGHGVGDQVISAVAQRLGRHLRGSDLLARYGGEEFVMLLPGLDRQEVRAVAERVRQVVCGGAVVVDEHSLSVTVSIGVAHWPTQRLVGQDPSVAAQTLLREADEALLRAKGDGRNRVVMAGLPPPDAMSLELLPLGL